MKPRIGWIGLGNMGSVMAPRLAAAGWSVTGYDTDARRAESAGLPTAASLEALVGGVDMLISIIPSDAAFLDVVAKVAAHARRDATLIDMSTISPKASATGAAILAQAGVALLRSPVSGSVGLAADGRLSLLVSGPSEAFDAHRDLLNVLGRRVDYLGSGDEARAAKLVINTIIGAINGALAEAVNLGVACGLDRSQLVDLIAASAAGSAYVTSKVEKLKHGDWSPAATVSLISKDLDMALALAAEVGTPTPLLALNRRRLAEVEEAGWGQRDMSAIVAAPTPDVTQTVQRLEDARYAAMLAADAATLEPLLDTRLRYIHSNGVVDGREAYLAGLTLGRSQYRRIERSDQTILPLVDSAIVLNRLAIDSVVAGEQRRIRTRAVALWSRSSGQWRLACVQSAFESES